MPSAPGSLKYEQGRFLGEFSVDGAAYLFTGTLMTPMPPFSISHAQVAYDSPEQLESEPYEFVDLPVGNDQIKLKLQNGVEVSGSFDTPFRQGEAKGFSLLGGGGGWLKRGSV
ncbi:uncharacterized protein N7459_001444 [Penicillium hispanicum]|uniref:uncharacterized protein n=1 Tax=Penicillium hispanicum TaxID=1080232 RepID=UPI002541980C|nr:uncharacterized protein N7459_001444 [Penicillium hispanicum]KAJ5595236.1 hypothetical protein N7459_001444 [Penicillium hispanicum]